MSFRSRRCISLAIFWLLIVYGPQTIDPAWAGTDLGVVQELDGEVRVRTAKAKRYIAEQGDIIHRGDLIKTNEVSTMKILLNDGSVFAVAPNSVFIIDAFVLDQDAAIDMNARLVKGAFSFVSATRKFKHTDRKIIMASATLSIRGTKLFGYMRERSRVVLLSGQVDIAARTGSAGLNRRNESVTYDRTGTFDDPVILSDEAVRALGVDLGLVVEPVEMTGGRTGVTTHYVPGCAVIGVQLVCDNGVQK